MVKITQREIFIIFSLYVLMLCGISIPNTGFLSRVNAFFNNLPSIEIITSVASYNLSQTRYSYIVFGMIVVCITFLFCILAGGRKELKLNKHFSVLIVLLFLIAFSAAIHFELISILKCIMYSLIILVLSTLRNDKKQRLRVAIKRIVVITATINSICILMQFASMYSTTVLNWNTIRVIRCEGIMLDPIVACTLNAFAICTYFFDESGYKEKKSIFLLVLWIVTGVMTGSRTFYLALGVIVIMRYLLYDKKTKGLLFAVVLVCSILTILFLSEYIQDYITPLVSNISDSSRAVKRGLAIQLFRKHPLFGAGTNQYRNFEVNYISQRGLSGTNPHNIYLQILCENGVFCFVILLVSIYKILRRIIKNKDTIAICFLAIYLIIGWTLGITGSVRISGLVFALVATSYSTT